MTETSFFWDKAGIGDYRSSYTDDEFSLAMLLLFNRDRTKAAVTMKSGTWSSFVDWLGIDAEGGNFRINGQMVAIVDGRIWKASHDGSDTWVTLVPASGDGYYAIVLRRSIGGGADQTVRLALLYSAVSAPTPTQTAATWECVLAQGQVTGGVASIDSYEITMIPQHVLFPFRKGKIGVDPWFIAGDDPMLVNCPVILAGVMPVTPAGSSQSIKITFPEAFERTPNTEPIVFVTAVNLSGGTPSHSNLIRITDVDCAYFVVSVDDDSGIESFNWIAIGQEETHPGAY